MSVCIHSEDIFFKWRKKRNIRTHLLTSTRYYSHLNIFLSSRLALRACQSELAFKKIHSIWSYYDVYKSQLIERIFFIDFLVVASEKLFLHVMKLQKISVFCLLALCSAVSVNATGDIGSILGPILSAKQGILNSARGGVNSGFDALTGGVQTGASTISGLIKSIHGAISGLGGGLLGGSSSNAGSSSSSGSSSSGSSFESASGSASGSQYASNGGYNYAPPAPPSPPSQYAPNGGYSYDRPPPVSGNGYSSSGSSASLSDNSISESSSGSSITSAGSSSSGSGLSNLIGTVR
jgi:hypothetical protein